MNRNIGWTDTEGEDATQRAFHDAGDQLQRFQQGFALNGEMHGLVPCLVE